MRVIDEKPKRGQEKVKRSTKRERWEITFFVLGVIFLALSAIYMGVCTIGLDVCSGLTSSSSIYLTVTLIVQQNATTEAQLSVTQGMPSGEFGARASPDVPHIATSISVRQTRIAATQEALATRQAQIIPTLTALATSTP
jgi:hypothetical protein